MRSRCVRTTVLAIVALVVSSTVAAAEDNVVLRWNAALLRAVRTVRSSPPVTARALAIVHT